MLRWSARRYMKRMEICWLHGPFHPSGCVWLLPHRPQVAGSRPPRRLNHPSPRKRRSFGQRDVPVYGRKKWEERKDGRKGGKGKDRVFLQLFLLSSLWKSQVSGNVEFQSDSERGRNQTADKTNSGNQNDHEQFIWKQTPNRSPTRDEISLIWKSWKQLDCRKIQLQIRTSRWRF